MSEELRQRLNKLLERREKYFLLEGIQRKIYQHEFENVQAEIIRLKLHFEIYHDELDMFSVFINYRHPDCKEKYQILEDAASNREVRWVAKKYTPETYDSEYVGKVLKQITNEWLKDIYFQHLLKRQGYIDCPWPTKLNEEG